MVRIRLRRAGGKGQPTHRIVAADKESPRDGKFIEILGDYNPRTEPATIRVKEDRIYYWLSVGAQPSDAVLQVFGMGDQFLKGSPLLAALAAQGQVLPLEVADFGDHDDLFPADIPGPDHLPQDLTHQRLRPAIGIVGAGVDQVDATLDGLAQRLAVGPFPGRNPVPPEPGPCGPQTGTTQFHILNIAVGRRHFGGSFGCRISLNHW